MSSQKPFERLSECRMIFAFCRVDKSRSMVRLLTPNLLAIFSTVNPPLFPPNLRISSMITFCLSVSCNPPLFPPSCVAVWVKCSLMGLYKRNLCVLCSLISFLSLIETARSRD